MPYVSCSYRRWVGEIGTVSDPEGYPAGCMYDADKRIVIFNAGVVGPGVAGSNLNTSIVHNVDTKRLTALSFPPMGPGGFPVTIDMRFQAVCKTLYPDNRLQNYAGDVVLHVDLSSRAHF